MQQERTAADNYAARLSQLPPTADALAEPVGQLMAEALDFRVFPAWNESLDEYETRQKGHWITLGLASALAELDNENESWFLHGVRVRDRYWAIAGNGSVVRDVKRKKADGESKARWRPANINAVAPAAPAPLSLLELFVRSELSPALLEELDRFMSGVRGGTPAERKRRQRLLERLAELGDCEDFVRFRPEAGQDVTNGDTDLCRGKEDEMSAQALTSSPTTADVYAACGRIEAQLSELLDRVADVADRLIELSPDDKTLRAAARHLRVVV